MDITYDNMETDQSESIKPTELLKECAKNNLEAAKRLIQSGAEINAKDSNLSTPLHWAAYFGNEKLVKVLINADLQADKHGIYPIHLAVLSNNIHVVQLLLNRITKDTPDQEGISPLHLAAYCGYDNILEALLDSGPYDINVKDKHNITPIHLAAAANNSSTVKILLARGVDCDVEDSFERFPVHWAATNGNVEMIEALMKNHYDYIDLGGNTPLYLATRYSHFEAIKFLLNRGIPLRLESGINSTLIELSNGVSFDKFVETHIDELDELSNALHWAAAFCSSEVMNKFNLGLDELGPTDNTLVHTAAAYGNCDVLQFLVKKKIDLDAEDEDYQTAMNWAAAFGYLDAVKLLNIARADKRYSLCWAAANGHLDVIDYLIGVGASIDDDDGDDQYQRTPLLWAATTGQNEVITRLLEQFPRLIETTDLIHWCAVNDAQNIIQYLLDHGMDVNESDLCFNRTALHWAAIAGNYNMAKFLISKGASVNAVEDQGDRPIHYAVNDNHIDIVKLFIENGAEVNPRGDLGYPICLAAENDNVEIFEALINANVNIFRLNNGYDSENPIHLAATTNKKVFKYLIEKYKTFPMKMTKFVHYAAEFGKVSELEELLKLCETVDVECSEGYTPLFYACSGNIDNLLFLIKKGANVNHKSSSGFTPLHKSIQDRQIEISVILMKNGADINAKTNNNGYTPIMLALIGSQYETFKLLIEANLEIADKGGETPLMRAATLVNIDFLKTLLLKGVNINRQDSNGLTALHHAIIYNNLPAVQILLKHGAYVNTKTNNNVTPMTDAVISAKLDIMRWLIVYGADVNLDPNIFTNDGDNEEVVLLLINAGLKISHIKYPDDPESVRYQTLKKYQNCPLLLTQLARIALRDNFKKYYSQIIWNVNIPLALKRFLSYGLNESIN